MPTSEQPVRFQLPEEEVPFHWYNAAADDVAPGVPGVLTASHHGQRLGLGDRQAAGVVGKVVIGCAGGGSNLAWLPLPFLGKKFRGEHEVRIIAVEPVVCPTLTRGRIACDHSDSGGRTPLQLMHPLGSAPEATHAIRAAIDEAVIAKEAGENKTILFALSGHGDFDLSAYSRYASGELPDDSVSEEALEAGLATIPDTDFEGEAA